MSADKCWPTNHVTRPTFTANFYRQLVSCCVDKMDDSSEDEVLISFLMLAAMRKREERKE